MIIVQVTFLSRVIEQHEWVRMFLVFLKKKEKKNGIFRLPCPARDGEGREREKRNEKNGKR